MSDGKASLLAAAGFVAFMWLALHAWTMALSHGWLPNQVVQAASLHAQDNTGPQSSDNSRWYLLAAATVVAAVLAFRVYRWARCGRWQGSLSPKESALSSDTLWCAVAASVASIAVAAAGLGLTTSEVLRILSCAAIALGGWSLYPWLERRARGKGLLD